MQGSGGAGRQDVHEDADVDVAAAGSDGGGGRAGGRDGDGASVVELGGSWWSGGGGGLTCYPVLEIWGWGGGLPTQFHIEALT